jgi:hypothetical protein
VADEDLFPDLVAPTYREAKVQVVTPPFDAPNTRGWIDEVQVAVELPMGPPGPEGPAPRFARGNVLVSVPGGPGDVELRQNPDTGVYEFDFVVPAGPMGPQGSAGPGLRIIDDGSIVDPSQLPLDAAAGDAYLIGDSLWVRGADVNGGLIWIEVEGFKGLPGPPGTAWVNDDVEPDNPSEGQIWFRPSHRGYVPTGLTVENGLELLTGTAKSTIGTSTGNELVLTSPGNGEAKLSGSGLAVKTLTVGTSPALSVAGGQLVLGTAGGIAQVAGSLRAAAPVVDADVATKQYVDAVSTGMDGRYVNVAGDTMTAPLAVPDGTAAEHAVNKKQLDAVSTTGSVHGAFTLTAPAAGVETVVKLADPYTANPAVNCRKDPDYITILKAGYWDVSMYLKLPSPLGSSTGANFLSVWRSTALNALIELRRSQWTLANDRASCSGVFYFNVNERCSFRVLLAAGSISVDGVYTLKYLGQS